MTYKWVVLSISRSPARARFAASSVGRSLQRAWRSSAPFLLGLFALRNGSAAVVRSASVVLATALAGRVLSEHVSRARLAGSVLVFAGIALLAV